MKVAIMQPYFFPYIGYFQLINLVDEFVVYDNIQYTKKGWINRNRILVNQADEYITLPLKKDSDYLNVNQRFLSDAWTIDRKKMLNKIVQAYRKAPQFDYVYPLLESCLNSDKSNLFDFIFNSLHETLSYLSITTTVRVSSSIDIDHQLKSEAKVLAICKAENAKNYINPIGGIELYNRERFELEGIQLQFLKTNMISYSQRQDMFIPSLSIIDVLMFNSKLKVKELLDSFVLQ